MALINEKLRDEIESLNAIYGEGTLCVVRAKAHGIVTRFRIPAVDSVNQLAFELNFPLSYPEVSPEYLRADVGLFESRDRRIQNIGVLIWVLLQHVFVQGNECMYDMTELVIPLIECMDGQNIDVKRASTLCPELEYGWRWMEKPWINMETFKQMIDCVICGDEDFAFRLVQVPCRHNYCTQCFKLGWDLALKNVEAYTCCKTSIPVELIQANVESFDEEAWIDHSRQVKEKTTWNALFCANRLCGISIGSFNLWDVSRGTLKSGIACRKCSVRTCGVCREVKHPGSCDDRMLKKLMKAADIRKCTHCGHGIEKNGGCAHIQCSVCRSDYWWREDGELGKYP